MRVQEFLQGTRGVRFQAFDANTAATRGHLFGADGVCAPLVYLWLRSQVIPSIDGMNFKDYVRSADGQEEIFSLKLQQHANRGPAYAADYLALSGIRLLQRTQFRASETTQMLDQVRNSHCFYYMGFTSIGIAATSSGHAMGINARRFRFFDPNWGQFLCDNSTALHDALHAYVRYMLSELSFGRKVSEKYEGP